MRKIREVLRLKHELGLSERQIAASVKLSKAGVGNYLRRARGVGLAWPLPPDLGDEALEAMLYARSGDTRTARVDWAKVHQELSRPGVTLELLWREYRQHCKGGEGLAYSTFTIKYGEWKKSLDVTMRQFHKAGEKLFVDWAGTTLKLTDPHTGEVREGQVFVAVMGASNYTYSEVTETQGLVDWLGAHRRALEHLAGVPRLIVPDNTKTAVKQACYYEPDLNRTYLEFAEHYGTAILPTRVRKPRDKAKVETGVQSVERRILAPLRDRTFFSLAEANQAVWELLDKLNAQPFQKLPGSRKSAFEELDRPLLKPLPATPFVLSNWKKARVNIDYHIEVDGHYYSVPYQHVRAQVDLRLTQNTIEVYLKGERIASHPRLAKLEIYRGKHTTIHEHMPKAHQRHAEWTPQRIVDWASKTGENTARVVETIMASRPHPEMGFRSCLGIMRLGKSYGQERLEAACRRACHFQAYSYKSVQAILKNNLDQEPLPSSQQAKPPAIPHPNLRGADYYRKN
jgi:transposase